MTLTVWGDTRQIFGRWPSIWDCLMFSWLDCTCGFGGEGPKGGVLFSSHHIRTLVTGDVNFGHWAWSSLTGKLFNIMLYLSLSVVTSCFIYFGAIMLDAYSIEIVISYQLIELLSLHSICF